MKKLTGTVVTNQMTNAVVVAVRKVWRHPLYKKVVERTSRIKAHTDKKLTVGDVVTLIPTRPLSKQIHFKVGEVVTDKKTKT